MSQYREGKSGVNVRRLAQNIADQYPFEPERAALIELVANSLDAEASVIEIAFDEGEGVLSVRDNGVGMDRRQFQDYHDFAASTKHRGSGIGFAGQGAKLALNFCSQVITETLSPQYRGYSEWSLRGDQAPWQIHDMSTLSLDQPGTLVTLCVNAESRRYFSADEIGDALHEHFYPLVDPELRAKYAAVYRPAVRILVNGCEVVSRLALEGALEDLKQIVVRFHQQPKALGFFGIAKGGMQNIEPGVMVCTYGKVIERTLFKKEPRNRDKIFGWLEAPYLIEAVTTDKCRFQRGNKTWEGFFRKAQAEFSYWLQETGLLEAPRRRGYDFADLQREINRILRDLPELSFFGSQRKAEVGIPDKDGEPRAMGEGTQGTPGVGTQAGEVTPGVQVFPGDGPGTAPTLQAGDGVPATTHTRTIRGGIRISADDRPDMEQESWFDGEAVTINKSHPAYTRATAEDVLNYHYVKAIALSLIEFNLDRDEDPSYRKVLDLQQRFFRLWGQQ